MLFKKEKKSLVDTMFFDEFKKILKNSRKDIKKLNKDMSDIDECYKMLKKTYPDEKVFFGLLMREEEEILEMLFRTLLHYETQNINIPDETYDILNTNVFMFDRYMDFIENILGIIQIDENARWGYLELDILLYREIVISEKKRLAYIKKLAEKKNVNIEKIEVTNMLYVLDTFYKKGIQENPDQDKSQLIRNILRSMPDDAFDKFGFSPFRPITKK